MLGRRTFKVYGEKAASEYLEERLEELKEAVGREEENYLLNVNEEQFIQHLVDTFTIDIPRIDFEHPEADVFELDLSNIPPPADSVLHVFAPRPTQAVVYHLHVEGNHDLLKLRPNPYLAWTTDVFMEGPDLCFTIGTVGYDHERVKRESDHIVADLRNQHANLAKQLEDFNRNLSGKVTEILRSLKADITKKYQMLESLGVGIRKRDDLPATFAVPFPKKKRVVAPRPAPATAVSTADPTLDQDMYIDILNVIHDFGRQLERMPSTYKNRSETDLRDFLLLILEPRYENLSTTGETFNKSGKTDILVRYQKSNLFVSECLYWDGAKAYLDKITQLLGYLTWRDSKSALIVFVTNKDFSSVLAQIEAATPTHPNYVQAEQKVSDTMVRYRFRLAGDSQREIQLAVLAFHLPPS